MENAAARLSFRQLMEALLHMAKIDRISKGAAKGDAWDELLQLGLCLSAARR
jgi:DNA polymerase-3 subunit delta